MLARLSLRFIVVLALCGAALLALVTMFEAMIGAPLSFGTATVVVLPLLFAARSCGAAWVVNQQTKPGIKIILGYGFWLGLLGLAVLVAVTTALQSLAPAGQIQTSPTEVLRLFAQRPGAGLMLIAISFGTVALITCTGFALGVRAQMRLLSQPLTRRFR
ncbi:MAG: hypothetical protein JWS10_1017 [Cypionkella sp.]|uniref:hypothetical protein n=1 Tax=Cypionkella sp. TaxID=2811411 RepID=UPI002609D771|nr:hypothetical protein [Cypionkella sp.]MDB5658402.1 hypothetical protein [Cypionkella sp.]